MTLILIIGLSLIAASVVLVLRSFSLADAERRRTLDQIAVYGFRSSACRRGRTPPTSAAPSSELATATGERALARFDGLGGRREGDCASCSTRPGMYQTSVASFVGLAHPRALSPVRPSSSCSRWAATRYDGCSSGCVLMSVMGWYLPYVRVQAPCAPAARADRP